MAATYTPGSGAALDRVRLLIPDKDLTGLTPASGVYTLTTYQYTDAEIADFLTLEADDVYGAAALALESAVSASAQISADIHSSATRPRPMPAPANTAKPIMMASRKPNRTMTWTDCSC